MLGGFSFISLMLDFTLQEMEKLVTLYCSYYYCYSLFIILVIRKIISHINQLTGTIYKTIIMFFDYTVPFNYNFIFTRVSTRGNTRYFACVQLNSSVEILISTRRDVAFPRYVAFSRDVAFPREETWHLHE